MLLVALVIIITVLRECMILLVFHCGATMDLWPDA